MWFNIPVEGGTDREFHRGEKSFMPDPSREVANIVENVNTSKRTLDTLRRTKVPQRMSNSEDF